MDSFDIKVLDGSSDTDSFIGVKIKERASEDSEVPFYVCNLDDVCEKHLRWQTLLPNVKPFYAVKCNDTPAVLRTLSALGTGFDCASKREMEMVLSLGVSPDRIIYGHTTKLQSHLRYACAAGVDMMMFDSEEELEKISMYHPKAKLVLQIFVDDPKSHGRVNSKVRVQSVGDLLKRAQELHLTVSGVSFHLGSYCTDSQQYKEAIADARLVFDQANLNGIQMNLLDIGGGFIGNQEFVKVSEDIKEALGDLFPADSGVQIIAEPGPYFVNSAFTLAANIFATKQVLRNPVNNKSLKNGMSSDTLMMYYLTDGVFGAFSSINPVAKTSIPRPDRPVASGEPRFPSVLWGPTCAGLDRLQDVVMPKLQVGDWILFDHMGAYSQTLSTHFNGFEKAPVYSVITAASWKRLNRS